MTRAAFLLTSVVLLLGLGSCSAPSHSHPALEATREFYAWYLPIANGHKYPGPAAGAVLEQRTQSLTSELAAALRDDVEAQARAQDIVGLVGDFDPFLDSQGPCAHYESALTKATELTALVRVQAVKENGCSGDEIVTVEWTLRGDHWQIANLHYKQGDLLTELKEAHKARDHEPLQTARDFYAWYVPIALKSDGLEAVLKQRPNSITKALAAALQADRAAAEKNADEIVGLDGDPFLDSQDPCERYELGESKKTGPHALIPVFGICQGKRGPQPDFTVEMVQEDYEWRIANIHFQRGGDLVALLAQLKHDREHPPK